MHAAAAGLVCVFLLTGCGGDEPRLSPVIEVDSSQTEVDSSQTEELAPEPALNPEPQEQNADPMAELESSVLVPNVVLNFTRGSEDACIAALALTSEGELLTQGFTYNDTTCRRLVDSIPIPELPGDDIDTAYLRGFEEMLSIMFRPGQLCSPNGECFVKEDVLPVLP
jgi:hypothetical protein